MGAALVVIRQVGIDDSGGAARVHVAAALGRRWGAVEAVVVTIWPSVRRFETRSVRVPTRSSGEDWVLRERGMNHERVFTRVVIGILVEFDGNRPGSRSAFVLFFLGATEGA